jgi:hypothetical protein
MPPRIQKFRVKSFSLSLLGFGGGLGWEVNDTELKEVRRLVAFLEDRRVLFNPIDLEIRREVDISVDEIRSRCTELIGVLNEKSPAVLAARAIREACRKFLNQPRLHVGISTRDEAGFFVALGEIRATIGLHVAALAEFYKFEVEKDLASILPQPLKNN